MKIHDGTRFGDEYEGNRRRGGSVLGRVKVHGHYEVVCRDKDGNVKWRDEIENIIVNTGLDNALDVWLSDLAADATHYIGLTDGSPTVAAADTMASHAGWAEVAGYSEANRQAWTEAGVSGQSIDNSASKATFSVNATITVGGAFLTTNNTKSGTTGTLISVGAFTGGNKAAVSGDTIEVTLTITAADDGA